MPDLTATDHRNGHHSGRDRACWRCTIRARLGRTPRESGHPIASARVLSGGSMPNPTEAIAQNAPTPESAS